jgi:GNAT superfamily N-acetyltransferase
MKIRLARLDDAPRIGALAQRLREGPLPAWRDPAPLSANLDQAEAAFFGPESDDRVLLVCVDDADRPIGFAQAMMDRDFFSQETQGHLLFLVTDQAHERRGVARLLVTATEDWSRARGATGLMLYVFASDDNPRAAYRRFGFQEDMVKMVKPLGD